VIEVRHLTRRFRDVTAVDDVSFAVAAGELLTLVGGSGSGKTTLLRMINRLIEPTTGQVLVDGADIGTLAAHELRRRIGYAFQRVGLFPHMTVAENVAITPRLLGWDATRMRARVDELLALVELEPSTVRDRFPSQLSGGQQQRVGVARALAAEPSLMLLDEPFGALDPRTRDRLQETFQRIRKQLALTAIFVTHDMAEALLLADRIAVVDQGRLVQIGTPRELATAPATESVRALLETPRRQAKAVEAVLEGMSDGATPRRTR
jgi:osmoprotectant transport system ATP-binding protein